MTRVHITCESNSLGSRFPPRHRLRDSSAAPEVQTSIRIIIIKNKKKTSAIRAPALLSLLQDLRTNIVKNTTVTVYESNSTGGARRVHGSTYILN